MIVSVIGAGCAGRTMVLSLLLNFPSVQINLFDEIEKTDAVVKNALLNIFEKGIYEIKYTVKQNHRDPGVNLTEVYHFKKSIFINQIIK